MKIIMHLCCGPCSIYPLSVLQKKGITVEGFFFNPNIHPFKEFKKRLDTLKRLNSIVGLKIKYIEEYGLKEYLRQVVFHEKQRCSICYEMRLTATVHYAKAVAADGFTTTLLYSRYQQHDLICQQAEQLANEHKISFYHHDFRQGWEEGINKAKKMNLYRQPYCGCIYSEQERYDK